MPRMSAEKFCRIKYPNATIERRMTNGHEIYYLIRKQRGDFMPICDGKTKQEAWQKLRKRIENNDGQ
jgi:hypothetical protein